MNANAELLLEWPQDPEEWLKRENSNDEQDRCPSFLAWPETEEMIKDLKLTTTCFDQNAVGAGTPKPTSVIRDVQEIQCFEGLKAQRNDEEWPERVKDGIERSKRMAQWVRGMVRAIVTAMRRFGTKQEAVVRALTAKETAEIQAEIVDWEAHLASGHIPFWRDCMMCLESMGRSRPRKKQNHPDSYMMAVDVTGPSQPGGDQEFHQPRHLMAATVTIPMKCGEP